MVKAISGFGRLFGGVFGKLARIKFSYYFIVILLIQSIIAGIQSGNGLLGVLMALGERFFNMFQSLHEISLSIIETNGVFDGFWSFIKTIWSLISNVLLIFIWYKVLFKFVAWSPVSSGSSNHINLTLSIILLITLQFFYLVAMKYWVGLDSLSSYSFPDLFIMPLLAIKDFFRAILIIFTSIEFKEKIEPIIQNTQNLSSNLCSANSSICVI